MSYLTQGCKVIFLLMNSVEPLADDYPKCQGRWSRRRRVHLQKWPVPGVQTVARERKMSSLCFVRAPQSECSEQAITKGTEKIGMRGNLTLKTGGRLREAPT